LIDCNINCSTPVVPLQPDQPCLIPYSVTLRCSAFRTLELLFMTSTRLFLLLVLVTTGCQMHGRKQEARIVEPVLPATISRDDLVAFLNRKTDGLQSWRCVNTQVHVKSPELPFAQKLKGTLACASPGQFRVVCDNTMGHADLGANEEICWAYVKPGESLVMTWRHDDSALLQHLPFNIPRLEPEWLMAILGVRPLDASDYTLQKAPLGAHEVWLVAVEDAPDGTSLRRVIKVDTLLGVARLHALYDSESNPLLMAHLSDYKSSGGHELPHSVRIEFPATETQLTLKFTGIETSCVLEDSLWQPPTGRGMQTVDLGDLVRKRMQHDPVFAQQQRLKELEKSRRDTVEAEQKMALADSAKSLTDGFSGARGDSKPFEFSDEPDFDTEHQTDAQRDRSGRFRLSGDTRYFDEPGLGSIDDRNVPSQTDPTQDIEGDRKFMETLRADSAVPDFDSVAPSETRKKRTVWFPFRK